MNVMNHPHLPRCVRKKELANYFGVNYATIWSTILTEDLLEKWGYDYETQVKTMRALDPILTRRIYEHFKITDLNKSIFDEMKEKASTF